MDFSQDSICPSEKMTPNRESGPLSDKEPGKGARPKNQPATRGKRKADEGRQSFDSLENIPLNQLPKNITKQADLLESMRVMINRTVVEAVEASSDTVKEEINLLKTSFDNQLRSLSEKETRHQVETNLNVREELEKISTKLTGLDQLRIEVETSNKSFRSKLQQMEARHSQAITDTDERISTLEITEDTHFKSLNKKYNDLENRIQFNEEKTKSLDEKMSSYDGRLKELEFAMSRAVYDTNEMKEHIKSMSSMPEDYAKLNKVFEMKRANLVELATRAEKLMENLKTVQ